MLSERLKVLAALFPEYEVSNMRPGAKLDEIRRFTESNGPLSSDLISLYSWHNGSDTDFFPDMPLFGFRFFGLDESIEYQTRYARLGISPFPKSRSQLLGEADGSLFFAVVDLDGEQASVYRLFEGEAPMLFHSSVSSMVETAIEVWSTDGRGKDFDDVRLRHSPGADSF